MSRRTHHRSCRPDRWTKGDDPRALEDGRGPSGRYRNQKPVDLGFKSGIGELPPLNDKDTAT